MAVFHDPTLKLPAKPPKQPKPGKKTAKSKWGPWFSHDPGIFRDPDSKLYYTYSSEGGVRRSKDLITWEYIGEAVKNIPKRSKEWNGSDEVVALAPDVLKVGDEYRLYSAAGTGWGVPHSSLYLLVGNSPEGPFTPRDAIVNSKIGDNLNAIDANIVIEEGTDEHYLVYGSFWGGIHIVHINPRNGTNHEENGFGKCIARRPKWCDSAIEGPYIKYNPDTGYYYLFVSYGSLRSDYNIRVGRSKCVTGPYFDVNGRDMTDVDDFDNRVGYMITCGYRFDDSQGWMAPGHCSVLHDEDDSWYLVHHARPYDFEEINEYTMQVRKMLWSDDGWPLVSPECYAGEKEQCIDLDNIIGHYEFIKLSPMTPQGVLNSVALEILTPDMTGVSSTRNTWALKIPPEAMGRVELGGSMRGYWTYKHNTLTITYANCTETYKVLPAWDWELDEPTIILTGKDNKGVACWAKKADLPKPKNR